jgi:hypothetical protein
MGDSGLSYKLQKPSSSSQAFGPSKQLEVQRIIREKITLVPMVGNILIPINTSIRNCCAQFYKPELDSRIKAIDRILGKGQIARWYLPWEGTTPYNVKFAG